MSPRQTHILHTLLPVGLFALLLLGMALAAPPNDLTRYFLPAGRLLGAGASPYSLNAQGPFIYWPFGLWVFPLLAAVPGVYYLLLAANGVMLLAALRRIRASWWWLLYPPALYTLLAGQLDILALLLGVLACRSGSHGLRGAALLALALAIKPQAALFWLLPWLWNLPTPRDRVRGLAVCGTLLLLPMLLWWLAAPGTVTLLWREWVAALGSGAGAYVGDSPSLWAAGLTLPALAALGLWLVFGRHHDVSRPLLALGLPALRYYSAVALVGAAPAWAVLVGYGSAALTLLLGTPVFWLDPLVMAAAGLWRRRQSAERAGTALIPPA